MMNLMVFFCICVSVLQYFYLGCNGKQLELETSVSRIFYPSAKLNTNIQGGQNRLMFYFLSGTTGEKKQMFVMIKKNINGK